MCSAIFLVSYPRLHLPDLLVKGKAPSGRLSVERVKHPAKSLLTPGCRPASQRGTDGASCLFLGARQVVVGPVQVLKTATANLE